MADEFDKQPDDQFIEPLSYATPQRRTEWAIHWGLPALVALMILVAAVSWVLQRSELPPQFPDGTVRFLAK